MAARSLSDEDDDANTPENDDSQPFSDANNQSQSVWARLIPVYSNHAEPSLNKIIEFRECLITIGRDDLNDVTLKCAQMSSKHCRIERNHERDTVFLEDISTNGTWVGKKKLNKSRLLLSNRCEIIFLPGSKRRNRRKISYFFHMDESRKDSDEENEMESKYYVIRTLGAGAFAEVKLCQNRESGEKYAVKCISRNSWQRMQGSTQRKITLLDEIEIMLRANHPNIVKVHEYFESSKCVSVVLDYCGGGDMLEFIQKNEGYDESKAKLVFMQLINAIEYLHSLSIAHRDLKPDNILLCDKQSTMVKITDFGISRTSTESVYCETVIGTPLYQAPEV